MSNKPRSGQISTNTGNFNYILSVADDDSQKAFDTIDNHIHGESRGGTGQTTYQEGDILYSDGYDSLTVLPIGDAGAILKSDGYAPYWSYAVGNFDFILVGKIDILTPNSTLYLLPNYSESNNEDFITYIVDGYGILDNLMIHANTPPGGVFEAQQTLTITVRVDGYDTILTEILAYTNTDITNSIDQVAVSAGSLITIKAETSSTCAAADVFVSVRYTQQQTVSSIADYITTGKVGVVTPNTTRYLLSNFSQATTETFPIYQIPTSGTLSGLNTYCATPPGFGDDIVLTVRVNGIDTLLSVTISDTNQTSADIVNTIDVSSGDLITLKSVTSATCAVEDLFIIMRYNI
jgi:hypothetical protein